MAKVSELSEIMGRCETFRRLTIYWSLFLIFLPAARLLAQEPQRGKSGADPRELPQQELSSTLPASAKEQGLRNDYIIGPEDVLDIDVFEVPELSKTVRVANDGVITLALLGHIQAAGLTTRQLREELESKYGKTYLEKPQVSVFVREFRAQPVSIIGAVDRPGLYQLTAPRTLIEMLSMAGGLAKKINDVSGPVLYITRKGGFEDLQPTEGMQLVAPDKLEINIRRLLYSHEDALNIEIKPLDTISVTRADVVYVVGDVKMPGGFVLEGRESLTVLQALALAQGLNGTAAKNATRIIRKSPDGASIEIPIDLSRILHGKSQDVNLAANDILYVPNSAAKSAAKRGTDAAIGTMSGLLIYRRF